MGVNIGFIGTGVIASALVTGLCTFGDLNHKIYLSPRNAERAAELAARFENVTVASSNQEVLDKSEWVVISVVPKLGEEVLRSLTFRMDHRVINLMADRKLPEIEGWIGKTRTLVHMVPLSFAAKGIGPIALYPNVKEASELFKPLGNIVGVDDEKKIEALASITGLMSSYYTLLLDVVNWGIDKGLSEKEAVKYTAAFFEALSSQIKAGEEGELRRLAQEMTPGGLNEMALKFIQGRDGFMPWTEALEPVLARLKKTNFQK